MEKKKQTNVDFQMIIFLYLNARFSDEASFVSSQGMNGINLRELLLWAKATITLYDLSPRLFCIDATLLCEFESDKI